MSGTTGLRTLTAARAVPNKSLTIYAETSSAPVGSSSAACFDRRYVRRNDIRLEIAIGDVPTPRSNLDETRIYGPNR
jgi:hypothetical protein